jgi:NAD(P)-dependent dehydrogenase (short-subunit alcohol dehydrogenase family)
MISLQNKVSIITGGSRGIGAATAILFAKAGSDIVLNYVDNGAKAIEVAEYIRSLHRRVIVHQGNVGKGRVAKELVNKAISEFGKIDIVVNNAGIWTHGEIGSLSESHWDETLETNLKGVFNHWLRRTAHGEQAKG